jgi:hypothetical protein
MASVKGVGAFVAGGVDAAVVAAGDHGLDEAFGSTVARGR